jgi:hypothetical protein
MAKINIDGIEIETERYTEEHKEHKEHKDDLRDHFDLRFLHVVKTEDLEVILSEEKD